jgi:hypothetical protein
LALSVIKARAEAAGGDAGFLQALARVESSLQPDLRARTSTATGLFQFIEATWLDLLHRHGAKHGLEPEGLAGIDPGRRGSAKYRFTSAELRQQALDLRFDPSASAAMAAEYVRENGSMLSGLLARAPRATDLYLAHFLGPADARRFLRELEHSPGTKASALFPAAAAANQGVFFARDGAPRSIEAIYEYFSARFPERQASAAEPPPAPAPADVLDAAPSSPQTRAPVANWRAVVTTLLTLRLDWPKDPDD